MSKIYDQKISEYEINSHNMNTNNYAIEYLFGCDIDTDRDCNDAWYEGMGWVTITQFKKMYEYLEKNKTEYIQKYGNDSYHDTILKFRKSETSGDILDYYDFCSLNADTKWLCVNNIHDESCTEQIGTNIYNAINKKSNIYREICFEKQSDAEELKYKLNENNEGKIIDIGRYWSWKPKTRSYFSKLENVEKCLLIEGQIQNKKDVDIKNTYAINQVFKCHESEIRLNDDSKVKIVKIIDVEW